MGFPATGLESIYRNRRTDVQRFLTSRHGQDFWVFNFCPITENTYDKSVFQGRVSRYPFPDHQSVMFPEPPHIFLIEYPQCPTVLVHVISDERNTYLALWF